MHVLFIDIWMTVSDYNTNPTVIIIVGIGIFTKCMFYYSYLDDCIRLYYQSHSNYTSWDWNLTEMHVLFIIRMTVSDHNTNSTVIILIGILPKSMFYLLISGWLYQTILPIIIRFIFYIWITVSVSDNNTNPTVFIQVGIGILPKCMFYSLIDIWMTVSGYNTNRPQ
jgi:hypothetical protein